VTQYVMAGLLGFGMGVTLIPGAMFGALCTSALIEYGHAITATGLLRELTAGRKGLDGKDNY